MTPAILFLLATSPAQAAGPGREARQPPGAVLVSPGASIQRAVDAKPSGTTFFLLPGLYRDQSVIPKAGDAFVGAPGAVLNGAVVLTTFRRTGRLYVAHVQGAFSSIARHGRCRTDAPRCDLPRAVFRDGRPLRAAARQDQLQADAWFADERTGEVYVADDPAGHTLELSVAPFAFGGDARDVTVANLVIEEYASANQQGAVGGQGRGAGWTVRNNEVRWNYGYGIRMGNGGRVVANRIHHNGGMGVGGGDAEDLVLEGNEIARNSWNGVDCEWECGGAKWGHVHGLTVRGNDVHDNQGPGLWSDEGSADVRYELNKVEDNLGAGIAHEISFGAVIADNVVRGNGAEQARWGWRAQIQIQNSSHVEADGNLVVLDPRRGGNGITVIEQDRGPAHAVTDVLVHGNDVVMPGRLGNVAGYFKDSGGVGISGGDVRFEANRYHVLTPSSDIEVWTIRRPVTFAEWQRFGEDKRGSVAPMLAIEPGQDTRQHGSGPGHETRVDPSRD